MSEQLAAIRKLYFSTTKATIARDFDDAIDLLKSMTSDDDRERAAVYMEGLAQMKTEWSPKPEQAFVGRRSGAVQGRSGRSTSGGRRFRSGD